MIRLRLCLCLLIFTATSNGQIFCTPTTTTGLDFAKQIATVPVEGPAVPDASFHAECISRAGAADYCLALAKYPAMLARCSAYTECLSACKSHYPYAFMIRAYNDCMQACPIKLSSFCDAYTDYRALKNQVLPYTPTAMADYKLQVVSGDFSSRTSVTTTSWFVLKFGTGPVCNGTNTQACADPLFALPSSFLTTEFGVSTDTLMVSNMRQAPDIKFQLTSRLLRVGFGKGAFWTTGCRPPVLTLRVKYTLAKQRAVGYTVVGDVSGNVACYNRTLYVIDAGDDSEAYVCRFIWDANELRGRIEDLQYGLTYELRRANALRWMQGESFAFSQSGMRRILFSTSQINNIFDCIDPPSTTVGGKWIILTTEQPGRCSSCTVKPASSHMKTRHCNRTNVEDLKDDCCYSCTKGFMMIKSNGIESCITECKRNSGFDAEYGVCRTCPRGQFSAGGAELCKTCSARGIANARSDITLGCVPCLPRFVAAIDMCIPCPPYQVVQHNHSDTCAPCADNAFLATGATRCQSCSPGTFLKTASSACKACPVNTFTSTAAATTCQTCADGFASTPNRTFCLQCPSITSTLPLSRYFQPGCALQCKATAYLNTTPYAQGGCALCSNILLPSGTCDVAGDCSQRQPCSNAPFQGSFYTGPASSGCQCPFACLPGFSGPLCAPCTPGASFKPSLHAFTDGCSYDCAPGLFRDNLKACTTACVLLVKELADGRICARVSEYQNKERPHYILGQCGSDATIPTAIVPFLRRGWWAQLGDYTTRECGNALLEKGETCDDGNVQNSDGCSSVCQVETNKYWDCDLIGMPCLLNCGWTMKTTDAWGVSLRGWLLPACPNGVCSCALLSYYNVTQGGLNRGAWMKTHLVACNCYGNLQRTVPYQVNTLVCCFFYVF